MQQLNVYPSEANNSNFRPFCMLGWPLCPMLPYAPKLPKLEHVALNSASETGAENASKCTDLQVKCQKFTGGYAPRPHTGEGLRRPSPDLTPSALRRFAPTALLSGPSAPPSSPNQKSWIHPWAHPPSENRGYAYAR